MTVLHSAPATAHKKHNQVISMGLNYECYPEFHELPLAGTWRRGRANALLSVFDPFDGKLLASLSQATFEDLNDAYLTAAAVQLEWARKSPAFRADVMLRAVEIFDTRREEIIDWIIRESGSSRTNAMVEWNAARAITLESASFPTRVHGRIMPSNVPGKENRIYREALGVIGVISPWNFPVHLTQRSVAPALALARISHDRINKNG